MNVKVSSSSKKKTKRLGQKYRMRASDFEVVGNGFRKLRKELNRENPQWSHDDTMRYMYENDDDFKTFFDRQPSAARMVVDPIRSDKEIEDFIRVYKLHEAGAVPASDVMRLLCAKKKLAKHDT